jgi:hypothetical protein
MVMWMKEELKNKVSWSNWMKGVSCETTEEWVLRDHVSSWVSSHMSHMEFTVLIMNSHMKTVFIVI